MTETIVTALAAVIDELPAIGRDGRASQQQGGYAYRGIEQITAAAAPLFAKHGVVFVPQVLGMEIRELSVNNKPWTDTILTVRYRICGPGGPDDYLEATVVGIGRDNSDKGANKALTQAFKYALIQTLCIADAKDDADGSTHEADAATTVTGGSPAPAPMQEVDELRARIERMRETAPDLFDAFAAWKNDQEIPWPWPHAAIEVMHDKIDALVASAEIAAVGGDDPGPVTGADEEPVGGASSDSEPPTAGVKEREPSEREKVAQAQLAAVKSA